MLVAHSLFTLHQVNPIFNCTPTSSLVNGGILLGAIGGHQHQQHPTGLAGAEGGERLAPGSEDSIGQRIDRPAYVNAMYGALTPEPSPSPFPFGFTAAPNCSITATATVAATAALQAQKAPTTQQPCLSPCGSEITMAEMGAPPAVGAPPSRDMEEVAQHLVAPALGAAGIPSRDKGAGMVKGTMPPHSPPQRSSPSSFSLLKKMKMSLPGFRSVPLP